MKSLLIILTQVFPAFFLLAQDTSGRVILTMGYEFKTDVDVYDIKGPKKKLDVSVFSVNENDSDIKQANLIRTVNCEFDLQRDRVGEVNTKSSSGKTEFTSIFKREKQNWELLEFDKDSSYFRRETWVRKNRKYSSRIIHDGAFDSDSDYNEHEEYISRRRGKLVISKQIIDYHYVRETTKTWYTKKHKPKLKKNYSYGIPWLKQTWKYDNSGKLKEDETLHLRDGRPIYQYIYRYDKNGNIIEEFNNILDYRSSSSHLVYKYDSNNREIESVKYDADGSLVAKWTKTYDLSGNVIIEKSQYKDGNKSYLSTFKYNNYNLRIEEYWCDEYSHPISCYKIESHWENIDKFGNWGKVTEYLNGVPQVITMRKIEYY
jgi:flagellar hook protein FlgE